MKKDEKKGKLSPKEMEKLDQKIDKLQNRMVKDRQKLEELESKQ